MQKNLATQEHLFKTSPPATTDALGIRGAKALASYNASQAHRRCRVLIKGNPEVALG